MTTRGLVLGLGVAALCAACNDDKVYDGAFREPVAAAVLPAELGPSAEHEPIGFVANGVEGRIVPIALKQGRFLNDDGTAAFLRTNDLPTGGLRLLTSVAPYAPDPYEVSVFAGDAAFAQLVEVPWVVGSEEQGGNTVPVEGYASYYPPDLSAAPGVQLDDIEIKKGYTTSERWTLTSDGQAWQVVGSRSGRQPEAAIPDVRFVAEQRRLAFTIDGAGAPGDVITIDTWNGLVEHDVGGTPRQLEMLRPEGEPPLLAMIIEDAAGQRALSWFDPAARRVMGEVSLPSGAVPERMDIGDDGLLYVADVGRSAVWEVAPGSVRAVEHVLPWPVSDATVATVPIEQPDGSEVLRRTLFVVTDGRELWLFDLDTDEPIDVNPWLPGVQGLPFATVVQGIDAVEGEHLLSEFDASARRESGRTVAVSLADGSTVFARQETGCLVQDPLGPRTVSTGSGQSAGGLDYTSNYKDEIATGPYLEANGANGRHVSVNPCGGIALEDSWDLVFDQTVGGWRVISERRGEQTQLAYEDQRYTSDHGDVSFLLRAGLTPAIDGMIISFSVDEGVAKANGDNDGDGTRETPFGVPSDPITFSYEVGPRDGNWYVVEHRPYVLVLGQASDSALRIDPQAGRVDAQWQ